MKVKLIEEYENTCQHIGCNEIATQKLIDKYYCNKHFWTAAAILCGGFIAAGSVVVAFILL